jgi:hypothetical protein
VGSVCTRKANLRCDRSVAILNARSKGTIAANEQKMIWWNHDLPPQILRPLPNNNSRLMAMGVVSTAKIRRIFFQLPGSLFEVKIREMFDSPTIRDHFKGLGIQPLLLNSLRHPEGLFGKMLNLLKIFGAV